MKNKYLILALICLCGVRGFAQSMPELARKIAAVSPNSPISHLDFSRCKIRKNNLLYEEKSTDAKVALHRYYGSQGTTQILALIESADYHEFTLSFYRYDVKHKQVQALNLFFQPARREDFQIADNGAPGYWRQGASFLEDGTIVVDASLSMAYTDYYVYRWNASREQFDRYFHGVVPSTIIYMDETGSEREAQKYISQEIRPWVQDFNLGNIKWASSKSRHRNGVDFKTFYDRSNRILKAMYKGSIDGMIVTVEYFFKDTELIFIYSQTDCGAGCIEERFYLRGNVLIYYKGNPLEGTPEERYYQQVRFLKEM